MKQLRARAALLAGLLMVAAGGCQSKPAAEAPASPNTLTHGQVQLKLKTGVTTQQEVIDAFGAPNITTIDGEGREVWTYRRHATVQRATGDSSYFNVVVFGASSGNATTTTSSQSMTLIVKFDATKKVVDFRSMASSF